MSTRKGYLFLLLMLLGLTGSSLYAKAQKATEIAERSYRYMGELDRYTFHATLTEELRNEKNRWQCYRQTVDVKVDRPDKLRIDIKSKEKERTSYLNKGVFTMVDHRFGYYGEIDTPQEIDKALAYIFDRYGINAPLSALLYTRMQKRIHFTRSKYFGTREVAGVVCDYIAFQNRHKTLHLWIARGKEPLIRSFTLMERNKEGKPKTSAFIEWNIHPTFRNNTFVFVPSGGLTKISVESANIGGGK